MSCFFLSFGMNPFFFFCFLGRLGWPATRSVFERLCRRQMGIFSSILFSFCDVRGGGEGNPFFFFFTILGRGGRKGEIGDVWRTWYLLYADAVVDIHYIRLHYIPRSPTSTSQRLKSIYRHSQLEIPRLQLPPKHPLGILRPTNLQQPFPVRGPVPVKHSLPFARVVLIDEAVMEIAFLGGEVAAGYEAGREGED